MNRALKELLVRLPSVRLLFLLSCLGAGGCLTEPSGAFVLDGATLVDLESGELTDSARIVVRDGRIAEIGVSGDRPAVLDDRVIPVQGKWIIPGLWDMHVHLSKAKAAALPVLLGTGVTSVRDMGGDLEELRKMERAVLSERVPGPRIFMAGPMLEAPSTLRRIREQGTREPYWRTRVPVPDAGSAARVVDSVLSLGIDFLKIREAVSVDAYAEIARAARQRGAMIVGHPPYGLSPIEAARLGVASFEHASYPYPLDTVPSGREALLAAWREAGIHLVPTLVAWRTHLMVPESLAVLVQDEHGLRDPRRRLLSPDLVDEWAEEIRSLRPRAEGYYRGFRGFLDRTYRDLAAMHAAGIPVMAGSDLSGYGLFPGYALHEELEILVRRVGLSPIEAIRSASSVPARFFGVADSLGTVGPGKVADLLVLDANPLDDIGNTRRIHAVVARGRYYGPRQLHEMLQGLDVGTEGDLVLAPATVTGALEGSSVGLTRRALVRAGLAGTRRRVGARASGGPRVGRSPR